MKPADREALDAQFDVEDQNEFSELNHFSSIDDAYAQLGLRGLTEALERFARGQARIVPPFVDPRTDLDWGTRRTDHECKLLLGAILDQLILLNQAMRPTSPPPADSASPNLKPTG